MSHKTVRGQLGSAVADAGTFTVSYPARTKPDSGNCDESDFYEATQHRLVMNGAVLVAPDDFTITLGTSNITVTNRSGASWPSSSNYVLQLDELGKRVYTDNGDYNGTQNQMSQMVRSDVFILNLGAPDVDDPDGICASQSIGAGTSTGTTSGTINGALASGGKVVFDTPRNVVGAWTTSATITVVGKDVYGQSMVEKSAAGTSFTGVKAFKEVTRIWSDVAITSATFGSGNVLGLPTFLKNARSVIAEIVDGAIIDVGKSVWVPWTLNATDLAAPTNQNFSAPVAGKLRRMMSTVTTALPASGNEIGTVNLAVNGAGVTNSTLTSYSTATGGNGSVGDVATSTVQSTDANGAVAVGDRISVVASASWASAGAMVGAFEIVPTGFSHELPGTFVTGMTTAGGSTATTADVRGTYAPSFTPDGDKVIQLLVSLRDPGDRGPAQFTE